MTTAELILSVVVTVATLANYIMMQQIKLAIATERDEMREWVRRNFVQLQASRRGEIWRGEEE